MSWKDDARFDAFGLCDVYCEDNGYLYVSNEAFDYHGNYTVVPYRISELSSEKSFLIQYDTCGADGEYIAGLEKAPWNIAKRIILNELRTLERRACEANVNIINLNHVIEDLEKHNEKDGMFILG